MAEIFCPKCGKVNPGELEKCQFCGARLRPLASSYFDATPIRPGENPVIKSTSEFEKVKLKTSDLVRPGEEPTAKSTAALESTLPSWLRTLRRAEGTAEGKPSEGTPSSQSLPMTPATDAGAEAAEDQPDWLPGLGKADSEDDKEVPDWLASLREEKSDTSVQESASLSDRVLNTTGSLSAGVADAEWMARLGAETKPETAETKPEGESKVEESSLDWLDSLGSESGAPGTAETPIADQDQVLRDWLSALPVSPEEQFQPASGENENIPVTQEHPQEQIIEPEPIHDELVHPVPDSEMPTPAPVEFETPGPSIAGNEPPSSTVPETGAPDWLTNLGSMPAKVEEPAEEALPDWLASFKTQPVSEPAAPAPASAELTPAPGIGEEIPGWLAQYQAEAAAAEQQLVNKEAIGGTPAAPAPTEGTGPLPEWLAGIKKTPTPSDVPPALITNEETPPSMENMGEEFSLEMPDWISKLNPEQTGEKAFGGIIGASTPENLELSELPSWVQAMRPVESVVPETKEIPHEEPLVTEKTGPLAGLQGVLPFTPGLGTLRKPPAYTSVLTVTEGQQRYAAALEKMISGESQPVTTGKARLKSNRVWRWVITILLLAAIVAPIMTGIPATPATTLRPPEMVNAYNLVSSLPSNAPVLLVFDYEPALSGELEAAASPLLDQLLVQGSRLALISTTPTGPALAERFLHDSSASPVVAAHNYQSGQQYVNLGYLAGGPSGIQYFAASPIQAAQFSLDGKNAWTMPPLQGVKSLSDFAAIIVLTDNADTGRTWIEQTGSTIGSTPLLMALSAQAEPLILPYYASGQVKGIVTGLAGGEAYEQKLNSSGSAPEIAGTYWNSFGVATLVAELLIAIGAIWSAVAGWRAHRSNSEEKV